MGVGKGRGRKAMTIRGRRGERHMSTRSWGLSVSRPLRPKVDHNILVYSTIEMIVDVKFF
jgi:hypothetical protein